MRQKQFGIWSDIFYVRGVCDAVIFPLFTACSSRSNHHQNYIRTERDMRALLLLIFETENLGNCAPDFSEEFCLLWKVDHQCIDWSSTLKSTLNKQNVSDKILNRGFFYRKSNIKTRPQVSHNNMFITTRHIFSKQWCNFFLI